MGMMLKNVADIFIAILLMGMLLRVCYTDIRYRLIKNKDVVIILVLIAGGLTLHGRPFHYQYALIVLSIGIVLVLINIIGAGDIKLLAVLALSFTPASLLSYLVIMSFSGVVLAIFEVIMMKIKKRRTHGLPYGVAIVSSYILFFHREIIPFLLQQSVVTESEL